MTEGGYLGPTRNHFLGPMPLAEGGLPGLCFSALGAVVEGATSHFLGPQAHG